MNKYGVFGLYLMVVLVSNVLFGVLRDDGVITLGFSYLLSAIVGFFGGLFMAIAFHK